MPQLPFKYWNKLHSVSQHISDKSNWHFSTTISLVSCHHFQFKLSVSALNIQVHVGSKINSMIVHTGYYIWDSACLYLAFAKPNLIVNTDLLIILWNYFSLICKAEILYPPQFYLKREVLIQGPWSGVIKSYELSIFKRYKSSVFQML